MTEAKRKKKSELMMILNRMSIERRFGFEFEFPKEWRASQKPIEELTTGEMQQLIDEGRRQLKLVDVEDEELKCQSVN
jgi:hypothetical protein